ncbi:major facilitator superfamily transporter monocarboxylate [Grosmannia clavigera kw1407]|uniref:Major facilitator superfamily transporter monocarboxylate n=1 Tax=Grosmannia clavigera (strain kw1407 / UAMH 11150) TaxID=655863 RepID=F0XJT2_GROCL|nr:major facilitator superfamily transporter monocarboxylate [Grosmannia clavigera kw1407]EFX02046.1 major facilitator superfamily transporter monocarboxylate [Grosmannia clavigera kw1407]
MADEAFCPLTRGDRDKPRQIGFIAKRPVPIAVPQIHAKRPAATDRHVRQNEEALECGSASIVILSLFHHPPLQGIEKMEPLAADAVSLSTLGTRRTRAGVLSSDPAVWARALPADEGNSNDDDDDDDGSFHSTPPLPPVPRTKQAAVLAAAFVAISLTIGYNQSYGVFQEYYLSEKQDILLADSSPQTALLAFVGTLGAGLTWAGSIFVNPLLSRIDHDAYVRQQQGTGSQTSRQSLSSRLVTVVGVGLMAGGFLLASFVSRVWQLLLTQGLLYGIGSSMLYFPLLGPAPEYFSQHRGTAMGLMLAGGGMGSIILSPVLRVLLSGVGGRWTLRIVAAAYLVVGMPVAWSVPRSRFPVVATADGNGQQRALRRRTHVSATLLATPTFLLSAATALCQSAGAQLPLTFIPSYSVALGLTAGTGATLLSVANMINAVARVATGYAGDRFGRLNVLAASLSGSAVAVGALWGMSVRSSASAEQEQASQLWIAFIVLYSVAAGGYYALFPATIADVFGIRSYASVNGFIYFVRGCGTMVGSPIGGVLLGSGSKDYADMVAWDGALLVSSALFMGGVRWADAVRRGWAWRA